MSKGFDIPHNKHLGNSHDYWEAPQKNSKQIVVQPLQWLPIDRDENGFATEEFMDKIQEYFRERIPVLLAYDSVITDYEVISPNCYTIVNFLVAIRKDKMYTHYLPIPKLEV